MTAILAAEHPLHDTGDDVSGTDEVRPVRRVPVMPAPGPSGAPQGAPTLAPPRPLASGELAPALAGTLPLSLAVADLDEDGVLDLACGRGGAGRGQIVLYRGNVDAIFPHSPEAREHRAAGTFTDAPFFPAGSLVELKDAPDFVASGDFDNDGHVDLVAAARGRQALDFLAGDGSGALRPAEPISLPGAVTALVSGEIDRIDGLADLAVAIEGARSPAVLVFEGPAGALRSVPELVELEAPAESLWLVPRRAEGLSDLRIVGSGQSWLLEGRDRRRSSGGGLELAPLQGVPETGIWETSPLRLNEDALGDRIAIDRGEEPVVLPTAIEATITVNSAAGGATSGDGACTLREAIANANANGDTSGGDCVPGAGADAIAFHIAGGGALATIALASELPALTGPTTLDGNTQGCPSPPCIVLDGAAAALASGLTLKGGNSVVRGFAISRFDDTDESGISVESNGNIIEGNFIGMNAAGTLALGNDDGVSIKGGDGNTVGGTAPGSRNLISGNTTGLTVFAGSTANVIQGNYIGTDIGGTLDRGNLLSGIYLLPGADGNTIGGTSAAAANLISGNDDFGIVCEQANANQILGNRIGTNAAGTAPLGNTETGIGVANSSQCTIGGTAAGSRNVVAGNGGSGIFIFSDNGLPADGNVVQGNYLGTGVSGLAAVPNAGNGLTLEDTTNTLVGGATAAARNVVSGNTSNGIVVDNPEAASNQILGNYVGLNAAGAALGNQARGLQLTDGPHGNKIGGTGSGEGNVISANGTFGISMVAAGSQNLVQGNLIGLDPTGTLALGNGNTGVNVQDTPGATVGGTVSGARNVISANNAQGVSLRNPASSASTVLGNFIGTNAAGTTALPNAVSGVNVQNVSNTDVGGTAPGAANLISGNLVAGVGIVTTTSPTGQNDVLGNLIGTDVTGKKALGNGWGVVIQSADSNTVGGTSAAARNLISGNVNDGVLIETAADSNVVRGNWIGVDGSGVKPLANGSGGVDIDSSSLNTVGGSAAGAGNLIAFNVREGVEVTVGTRNSVLGNSIASNGLLGIELGDSDGVTPNDATDADTGGNNLQNYPVLVSAAATPAPAVTIGGSLATQASTLYRVEFFASVSCDGSGHGEGARFLGSTNVTTNGAGNASFTPVLAQPVGDGDAITATATDPLGNTSEFSVCVSASCSSLVVFGSTLLAADRNSLVWVGAQSVRFVRGPLAGVSTYSTSDDGTLLGASALDISGDHPGSSAGLYYLVRPLGCGSWQTAPGAEPGRDAALP